MNMTPAHARHTRSASDISAAMLVGALMLTSIVDGLELSGAATAAPVREAQLTRSQRAMCEECGVVSTTRQMARSADETMVAAATQYEVTVRMRDGSTRTFIEASSVRWRSGESIILIEGSGEPIN